MDFNPPTKPSFRSVFVQFGIILLTVLFVILLPAGIVVVLLALTFRCLFKAYVKYFKPELGGMVTILSSLFATDLPERNTLMSIVVPVTFDGSLDFHKIKSEMHNNLVLQKNPDGSLRYPELQQSLTFYCGYRFWKWDKAFDIDNHVHMGYKGKQSIDEEGLSRLTEKLLRKSFGNQKSPWELYYFPDYKKVSSDANAKSQSVGVVRLSHCLADGFSIIQMISVGLPIPEELIRRYTPTKFQIFNMVVRNIVSIIFSPYQLTAAFVTASDKDLFTSKDEKITKTLTVRYSDPIPIQFIKDLKNKLNTSFEAILITAYTGGLRKLMLENKMDIPDSVHCMMPVPVFGRRDKLRNNIKYALIELPVGVVDPDERQALIASQTAAQKVSRVPEQMRFLSLILGTFPIAVFQAVNRSFRASGVVSNLMSPFENSEYGGHQALDCRFAMGLHHGHSWFGITCLTFEGNLRIQTNYVESVVGNANPDAFRTGILDEIQNLINRHLV